MREIFEGTVDGRKTKIFSLASDEKVIEELQDMYDSVNGTVRLESVKKQKALFTSMPSPKINERGKVFGYNW
jgi:hypothetical protein